MLSLAPVASIFRDESFFKMRRIFLSPFLASSNFSKFRPDVRNSGRTFEIPVERSKFQSNIQRINTSTYHHSNTNVRSITTPTFVALQHQPSEFRSNVRDSGQTFEIPAEHSRFRPNVRNSSRTFEFPVECSKFRPNIQNSNRTFKIPTERSKFWVDV